VLVFVAICAALESHLLFEVTASMALQTIHVPVLAEQRVFGLRVIEILVKRSSRNPLPPICVVTSLAALLSEARVMGIGVTIGTLSKSESDIAGVIFGARGVASFAGHLGMKSSKWIAGSGVIKLSRDLTCPDDFPIAVGVTLQAVLSQSALMLVFMAGHASRRNAEKGFIKVLNLDGFPVRR
jgi:hypothetical protein